MDLVKVNLACGDTRFGSGWINIDKKQPIDEHSGLRNIVADLTSGIPLDSSSVDIVYVSHFLEHLEPFEGCVAFLSECRRILVPHGVIRASVPDFRKIAEIYLSDPREFYAEYAYHKGWFGTTKTWSRRLGISIMFGHKMLFDFASLVEVMQESGFCDCVEVRPLGHGLLSPEVAAEIVPTHVSHSLVVDGVKAGETG